MTKRRPKPRCEQRWLAFLDILGYEDLVKTSQADGDSHLVIQWLQDALDVPFAMPERLAATRTMRDLSIRAFSDCLCFSTKGGIMHSVGLLILVAGAVMQLAVKGIVVRGGVVRGEHFDDGKVLFSPALIAAYHLERDEAIYPRILLAPEVVEDWAQNTVGDAEGLDELVWRDWDGRHFLNYLQTLAVDPPGLRRGNLTLLRDHGIVVEYGLQNEIERPRVLAKYHWLGNYHNRFCRSALPHDLVSAYLVAGVSEQGSCSTEGPLTTE